MNRIKFVSLSVLLVSFSAYSQTDPSFAPEITPLPEPIRYYVPFQRSSNTFQSSTGELKIGTIIGIGSGQFAGETYNDVVFKLISDGHFELESFYQPPPPPPEYICTEDEVLSAIPQLSLDLNIVEVSDLIGCLPKYAGFGSNIEEGRTVLVGWTGADGQVNPAPGNTLPVRQSSFIGLTSVALANTSRPNITFHLLEGVVSKYSFSVPSSSTNCSGITFGDKYTSLHLGQNYSQVKLQLGCEGDLITTTVDTANVEELYEWGSLSGPNSWYPFYYPFPSAGASFYENIDTVFVNGELTSLSYSSNEAIVVDNPCSAAELIDAFDSLKIGDSEQSVLDGIDCLPDSKRVNFREGLTTVNYIWASNDYSASELISINRSIYVSIEDGIVSGLNLGRS